VLSPGRPVGQVDDAVRAGGLHQPQRTDHIITIEDPIEFVHENKKCLVNQREVGQPHRRFKDALRAALREDPDIVLVGEMRDLETVAIAIETAETGHLVFGTLHTSTAPSTVTGSSISSRPTGRSRSASCWPPSLKGVISQILCKKKAADACRRWRSCSARRPVANLIREAKIFQIPSVLQTSRKQGMCLMNDSLLDLVKRNVVEPARRAPRRRTRRRCCRCST
jgi:twitching motility protein PilT